MRREPATTAPWKSQTLPAELLDDRYGRAQAPEGFKQQPDALLHLLVRIENHLRADVVKKADGKRDRQCTAPGLVQQSTLHARLQHVQLSLAHGALQSQQQAVVELCRIVDTVLVENERIGEGAQLQQTVPIGGVASESRYLQPQHQAGAAQTALRPGFL